MALFELNRVGGSAANNKKAASGNEYDQQIVAGGLPPFTELVRVGSGWSSMAVAAVAALVVRPTTTAAFEIWNGYPSGGPSLIIEDIFTFNLVASAIQGTFGPWAMVTSPKSAPSAGANVTVNSMSGKSAYGGPVICGLSTTVVANGWRPVGSSPAFGLGTATPGGSIVTPVDGRFIVPPQCSLCLHTVAQTTAWTFQNGASWFERQLTLE